MNNAEYYLYCVTEDGNQARGPCKVGFSADVNKRVFALQAGNARRLVLAWRIKVESRSEAKRAEEHCLTSLRPHPHGLAEVGPRLRSEWVSASHDQVLAKAKEYLEVGDEVVREIR